MRTTTLFFTLLLLSATASFAQLTSDDVPRQRTLPVSEDIRKLLEGSRWHLGAFRVQPSFAIRDVGYENNVYGTSDDPIADWRSTVSAGARFILPVGPKLYLVGVAAPEYTYYQKLVNRRSFGGDYGASVLGLYNRLSFEAAGNVFRSISPVSSEVQRSALGTRGNAHVTTQIDILRRLSVFGGAQEQRQRYSENADDLAHTVSLKPLDRNESAVRGGIRYRFTDYLAFSVAEEKTTASLLSDATKDNRTEATLLGIHYDRPRTFLNFSVGTRTGQARYVTTRFRRFSTITGSYYASNELGHRANFELYGHRGLGYSVSPDNPYFIETRNGAAVTIPAGRRIALRVFGDSGSSNYPNTVNGLKRHDQVTGYGGGFITRLYRNVALVTLASRDHVKSVVEGSSHTIFRLATSLTFSGDLLR